jgi:predicted nucleic acid-binding protein
VVSPRTPATLALLVDTNVILDLIQQREPWALDAALLLDLVARGTARGFISAHAVTTVYYIVEKAAGRAAANTAVGDVLQLLTVVPLNTADFQRALAMPLEDYEDAVQVAACLRAGADYLVTRDVKHFKGATVSFRSPGEMLGILKATPAG